MRKLRNESLRILLAEDDGDLRAAFKDLLGREGFKVFEAATGLAALQILKTQKVTFSIMDVDMPGLTGFEVLRIARQDLGALPCIFVSGDSSRERMVQALQAGAFSMLAKPVNPELLRYSVQRLIEFHYRGLV